MNTPTPFGSPDFMENFTKDIQQWILGVETDTPEQIRNSMEGVVEKLNCTVALFVLQKLADLGPVMNYMKSGEPKGVGVFISYPYESK